MRVVIQRVSSAEVRVDGEVKGQIGSGLLLLVGVEDSDDEKDAEWIAAKVAAMRIFSDSEGKMNLSVKDVGGKILLISQFTLHAQTAKGNRPSFIRAARPEKAIPLYENVKTCLIAEGLHVETGVFGADMKVSLLNDGPVTISMDSRNRE